ncbi:MAG: metal-dependent hydrolase [Sulfurospirillum sp.]|nr:metal-dependent hydrolase [Sulfurospirillum sp.]
MQIIQADFILTCNNDFEIIEDGAVAFDERILAVGKSEDILKQYPTCEPLRAAKNACIMPGLINPHVHLEFSANKTTLAYGNFMSWLESVIQKREELLELCDAELLDATLEMMLRSGTTSFGAISSFGFDFEACLKSVQRVVYFAEVLGSRPDSIDILFADFTSRLRAAEDTQSASMIPAISVHSPYSTHPFLARNALDLAKKRGYKVSTHFMESKAERDWLDSSSGDFYSFFANFAPNARAMCNAEEYIELFAGCKTLFTHCVQAKADELALIAKNGGFITHCPVSNRLLGVGKFDLEKLTCKDTFTLGTDGLSSNISLSLWDEMRAFLLMHEKEQISSLAKLALAGVTRNAANALGLEAGQIEQNCYADMLVCSLDNLVVKEDLALQLVLHTHKPTQIFIGGKAV